MHLSHIEIPIFPNSSNSTGSDPSTSTYIIIFFSLILIMEHQELFHLESTYILLLILENYVSFNKLTTKISLSLYEILAFVPPRRAKADFYVLPWGIFIFTSQTEEKTEKSSASPSICFPHFLILLQSR